jgi:glucose/arabinose dehydrogenase
MSRRFFSGALMITLVAVAAVLLRPAAAQSVPNVGLSTLATGLGSVTSIARAGDGRLYLTIQTGMVRIWDGTRILPSPFLDLSSRISCCGERGLLSIAFHPRYAENGWFFVYFTAPTGDITVERHSVAAGDRDHGDPAGVTLLTITHRINANHNGGELQFGPDGYLYVGTGDGGSANDPPCNAQNGTVLLGKLLRLDMDSNADAPPYYAIPASNPFASSGTFRPEIWAYGLRNPWRFSFDRFTGDLWIGDVGQDTREEVDFQPRSSGGGENYGWKIMEGTMCGVGGSSGCPPGVPPCGSPQFKAPVFEYTHAAGDCSIIGGYIYRGASIPQLSGLYVYGDYCTGRIWGNSQLLTPRAANLQTFGEDDAAELYAGTGNGVLLKFVNPDRPARAGITRVPRRAATPRTLAR